MTTRYFTLTAAALLSGLACSATVQAQAIADPTFAKLDANNDGIITEAEAMAMPELHEQWERLDANHDNRLAPFEFEMYGQLPPDPAPEAAEEVPLVVYRASELIGKEVTSTQGAVLGEIVDLVLESGEGHIAYLVMSFGEILGLGGTLLPLPWTDFTMGAEGRYERQTLHVAYTEEELEALEGFEEDDWPSSPETFSAAAPHRATYDSSDRDGVLFRAGDLIGQEVFGLQGESLGEVRDIVLDWQRGKIVYVAVAHGGLLGLGEELLPLPPELLSFATDGDRNRPRFDLTEAQLEDMASFEEDNWPLRPDEKIIEHTRQGEQYSD
ncbi:MAG: PRC-barrel domain-containing protein [Candidatus Competibacteraceae bacterium]|nr:PRC-barrel domain-containing protein [Candidatus Competibacteraceae bacterium]